MSRYIFLVLAVAFLVCVFVQLYFAGVAIFIDANAWLQHRTFVHFFGFHVPFFMLVFAMIGRMSRSTYWQIFALLFLIFLMYFTANVKAVGPMHVIVAFVLFGISCSIVISTVKGMFLNNKTEVE